MSITGDHPDRAHDPRRQVGPEGAGFTENPHPVGSRAHKRWEAAQAERMAAPVEQEAAPSRVIRSQRNPSNPDFQLLGDRTSPDVYIPKTMNVSKGYDRRKIERNIMRPGRGAGA